MKTVKECQTQEVRDMSASSETRLVKLLKVVETLEKEVRDNAERQKVDEAYRLREEKLAQLKKEKKMKREAAYMPDYDEEQTNSPEEIKPWLYHRKRFY